MINYQLTKKPKAERVFMNLNEIEILPGIKYFDDLDCARINNNAMQPAINAGSLVFFDKYDRIFFAGGIYLCRIPDADGIIVRRVFSDYRNLILKTDNKFFESYMNYTYPKNLVKKIILARVVKVLNNIG